ncbi:deleted in azoospermia-like [Oscarella lobularis]|uniref:deleted in azoospermia-like n=1 Tax=Oscarella lobularis TaxID=121494 RepID=UPI0033133A20
MSQGGPGWKEEERIGDSIGRERSGGKGEDRGEALTSLEVEPLSANWSRISLGVDFILTLISLHLEKTTASEGIDEKNGCDVPNRIFVGGISFSTTELELKTCFETFGAVRDSKIIADRKGASKGYGFITFGCQEDASRVQEQGAVYFMGKKVNVGPAIRKQPGERFHKPTSTTTTSVDRSSDGFESPQSSAEVAAVNHVDLTQLSHETVTPVCSLCCPVYAAPSAPTHCSCNALPPGFVPVATTPTNAWCYHGETCNSLQLVHPLLSDTESTCLPGSNAIAVTLQAIGGALLSPTAHAAADAYRYIEPDNTTAGPRVEIVGTPIVSTTTTTTTTNVTGSGRR